MTYRGNTILAVIPARGGSKGIPRKNLQKMAGVSLIGHAAKVALSLEWIDKVVLSTDDFEIAEEGKRHGVEVPFMRPPELATDIADSAEMWKHAWLASEEHYSCRFEISILLEPTSPLRTAKDVERTVKELIENGYAATATVSKTPAHFTPHKCLILDKHMLINFYLKEGKKYSNRQKIPNYYYRNGVCYALKRDTLIKKGIIIEENCRGVVIDRTVVNIDDIHELEYAEYLYTKEQRRFI